MTKKITWRLKEQPTTESLKELVAASILTKEEAREILFTESEEKDRDVKSLESEIKFLRELVEKLSEGKTTRIVETIRYVERPYIQYPWYQPYAVWCGTGTSLGIQSGTSITNAIGSLTGASTLGASGSTGANFSAIKTF